MPGLAAPARTTTVPAGTSTGNTCGAILTMVARSQPLNSGVDERKSTMVDAGTSTRLGRASPSVLVLIPASVHRLARILHPQHRAPPATRGRWCGEKSPGLRSPRRRAPHFARAQLSTLGLP